ncbi:hypothetical protein BU26DRAFT_22932 [Trematosphaeria pertusa]|uniref:Uncharacterized protein n=1 Tax=Trematosphaeria pertusa TaxID=390896 RepID=A0A6A6J121_9PLEO|nr:uncharacterized protein BU26DRAFT_22932 [Trematosphaeria pertusa]KAF2256464.1 hypothetical protein BU26DRAFT_22932 [Trematosphaeria pertusa]
MQPCYFSKLSLEMRDRVYHFAWNGTQLHTHHISKRFAVCATYGEPSVDSKGLPPWLLANGQIMTEAMGLFHRQGVLHVCAKIPKSSKTNSLIRFELFYHISSSFFAPWSADAEFFAYLSERDSTAKRITFDFRPYEEAALGRCDWTKSWAFSEALKACILGRVEFVFKTGPYEESCPEEKLRLAVTSCEEFSLGLLKREYAKLSVKVWTVKRYRHLEIHVEVKLPPRESIRKRKRDEDGNAGLDLALGQLRLGRDFREPWSKYTMTGLLVDLLYG